MTQAERYLLLQWHLHNYGRGFRYEVHRWDAGGWQFLGTMTEAKPKLQDEDVIHVYVTDTKNYHTYNTKEFTLRESDLVKAKEWKRKRDKFRQQYKRPRDSQRQKLYDFEDQFMRRREPISLHEARHLANTIYKDFGFGLKDVPKIVVGDSRRYKTSSYFPTQHEIRLARGWGNTRTVVLHEIAHALMNSFGVLREYASHGPEFTSLLIELYALYGPEWKTEHPVESALYAKARKVGIKFAPNTVESLIKNNGD